MKKHLVLALCSTLGVATALPALAVTNEVTGFFRARGILADLSFGKDQTPDSFVDQRFRAKWTMGLNDYVKIVYFGEIDFQWGDSSYNRTGTRNEGGALGGDNVNLETKNLYVEAKIPNTPVTATVGLQGYADNWDWVLFNADMSGVKLAGKLGNMDANVGWFKLVEESETGANVVGQSINNNDDVDMYAVQFGMKPMEGVRVGADLYYVQNNGTRSNPATFQNSQSGVNDAFYQQRDEQLYYFGVNGSYKLPMATISGWALYNFGVMKNVAAGDLSQLGMDEPDITKLKGSSASNYFGKDANHNINVNAWAAAVKADLAPAPGLTSMVKALVFSSDNDATDTDQNYIRIPFLPSENASFLRDGLMIFLPDIYGCTWPATIGAALQDAAYRGNGLIGLVANAAYVPPTMKQMYVKGALGLFQAMEKKTKVGAWVSDEYGKTWEEGDLEREGTFMGTELVARVGYVFGEKFDLSLNGSYAFLGNYYDNTVLKEGKSRPASGPAKGKTFSAPGGPVSILDKMPLGDAGTNPDNPYLVYLMANVNF